jgi:hypothetical protein
MKSDLYPVSNRRRLAGRLHHLGAAYDHATNVLWLRGADRRSHICIHELTHFFEHCSTPFGAFQTELHDATLALVTGFLQAHDGPVFTPVHDWARQVLGLPAILGGAKFLLLAGLSNRDATGRCRGGW